MTGKRIIKIKFLAISKDVKEAVANHNFDVKAIATKHGVSVTTVHQVRRTGTWPKWRQAIYDRKVRRYGKPADRKEPAKQERSLDAHIVDSQAWDSLLRKVQNNERRLDRQEERTNRIVTWVGKLDKKLAKRRWFSRG